eukprot:m.108793 g.108793  ORF g.108793 m.108793 type:complete len:102 (-) comp13356_c0_seq2:45-350(-)
MMTCYETIWVSPVGSIVCVSCALSHHLELSARSNQTANSSYKRTRRVIDEWILFSWLVVFKQPFCTVQLLYLGYASVSRFIQSLATHAGRVWFKWYSTIKP